MKTIIVIFTAVLITIGYRSSAGQNPFTATTPSSSSAFSSSPGKEPLRLVSFNGNLNGDKILLYWTVIENQDALQFEVERSSDGNTFSMIGLVFSTDKPDTAQYKFFEKAVSKKASYRIRMIRKDKTAEYSGVIVVQEAMNKTSTL
jgi:hypothetical protein